jgi:hypothetical protein
MINQKVMFTLLKKWFGASLCMRVIVALLYGLITLTASLHHTCYSAKEEPHGCHSAHPSCQFTDGSCAGTLLNIELNHKSSNSKVLSYSKYCLACLYSLTSKLFKLNSATSLVSVEAVVKVRFICHLNFIKQFEWFSSAPLRAPPIVTSQGDCGVTILRSTSQSTGKVLT